MKIIQLIRNGLRGLFRVAILGLPALAIAAHGQGIGLTLDNPAVQKVIAVQKLITDDLMAQPEILGTAVGEGQNGSPELLVFVNNEGKNHGEVMRALPPTLKGVAVRGHLTDPFRAFAGKPPGGSGGVSHSAKQNLPIQLGTSGGWRNDLANGYCCGGTLGSLVKVGTAQYIMSNYHVMESDIAPGGNGTTATTGDNVVQPGLIDVGCIAASAQNVATLVKISSLPGSNVDVGVAQVVSGMVRTDGAILEIGTISSATVAASVGQLVKKSGRTTGLTRSKVSALNATISVAYENECGGGAAFTKIFTGQIVIANTGSRFLNSGDSGSLMVEDVATSPRAVGLLYAGSSSSAIANPIGEVLTFVSTALGGKATMVGN